MITIHQRNQNVSNNDDTFSKSDQNSLPWVLPDKYITDWLTSQLISSLLILLSLFLPSTNMSLSEECNVLFSLMSNNSPVNRNVNVRSAIIITFLFGFLFYHLGRKEGIAFLMSNSCVSISLFSAESGQTSNRKNSLLYQQSLGMIQTRVPNAQFSLMTRSELQFS